MANVFLALGSNVGIGDSQFDQAILFLGDKLNDIKQARRYRSKAVGYTDQPDFLNTAIQATTDLSPHELLAFTQMIEQKVGRITRFHWGPREIDIDIILYDDQVIDEPTLIIPHARFRERDFVLKPLIDLDSKKVDPVTGQTVAELYALIPVSEHAVKD